MKKLYLFIVPIIACSCSVSHKIEVAAQQDFFKTNALSSAHIGINIYEPATRKTWYNYQGDKYFVPASNTKLATCFAAMKYLGDSLTGITYAENTDTLFVNAAGDPTFLHPDFAHQNVFDFLKNSRKVILINTSMWHENRWGNGWAWNDYNDDYMAERSAMPVYGNLATFKNDQGKIKIVPSLFSETAVFPQPENNNADFVHRNISSNTFLINPKNTAPEKVDVPFDTENDSTLIQLLRDTLHKPVFKNYSPVTYEAANEREIYSQPVDSLLKIMMHRSDNFFAEQSLLMVSNKICGIMNDEKVIDSLLKTDYKDLPQKPRWVDGSGLSRYNLFSPKDFVFILNKMKDEFGMKRIKNILATGGTGTIANYYKADSGFIYAKTGSLSGVIAFSGFLYTRQNKLLIFSILINNHYANGTEIRRSIQKFIEEIRNKY